MCLGDRPPCLCSAQFCACRALEITSRFSVSWGKEVANRSSILYSRTLGLRKIVSEFRIHDACFSSCSPSCCFCVGACVRHPLSWPPHHHSCIWGHIHEACTPPISNFKIIAVPFSWLIPEELQTRFRTACFVTSSPRSSLAGLWT